MSQNLSLEYETVSPDSSDPIEVFEFLEPQILETLHQIEEQARSLKGITERIVSGEQRKTVSHGKLR